MRRVQIQKRERLAACSVRYYAAVKAVQHDIDSMTRDELICHVNK